MLRAPMSGDPEILPFRDEHLDAAAGLLAERQLRLRALEPALSERWCDPAQAAALLTAARSGPQADGHVAMQDGRLIGYLVGEVRLEAPWERSGWVDLAGHAVAEDRPDVARDLYAAWSEGLVREQAVFRHLVNVPAMDTALVEAWHQLDFGQMHAYGLRGTEASDLPPASEGIRIRDGTPEDGPIMAAASELIWREQVGAPSWSPILPEAITSLRSEYVAELSEAEDRVWIAEDATSGEALGVSVSYRLDPELDVPDDNMKLAATATFATARRRGVGSALLRVVLENAAAVGAPWCVTDWRTSSLRASRAWTALGFRRTRLRLERRIDESIAWADGRS
jgi:GNAT superfamily N-acetyltransferase